MQTDFSSSTLALSPLEIEDLRKTILQGSITLVLPLIIGGAFSYFFYRIVPHDDLIGKFFVFAPAVAVVIIVLYLMYRIINTWQDLNRGIKVLVTGSVSGKYISSQSKITNSTIRNLSERTRHFIIVNRQRYLVTESDYDNCVINTMVKMYVMPRSKQVLDFEVADYLYL